MSSVHLCHTAQFNVTARSTIITAYAAQELLHLRHEQVAHPDKSLEVSGAILAGRGEDGGEWPGGEVPKRWPLEGDWVH